ncbi:MAG: hypothetical protein JSS06_04920 [Proteobacteria bacterium]|nr:hypothetical protein [Pseudomonadota bacterium]
MKRVMKAAKSPQNGQIPSQWCVGVSAIPVASPRPGRSVFKMGGISAAC